MSPKFIDIHTHLNFVAFDGDRDEVIAKTLENDTWMINVGTQKDTSASAVELANKYKEGVYAIVGLHPIHSNKSYHDEDELGEGGAEFTSRGEDFDREFYEKLLTDSKVVGIGECGLDYFRGDEKQKEKQKRDFSAQVELAIEYDKPIMIHCREAYDDVLEILTSCKKMHGDRLRGDVHFFAGDVDTAKKFLDLGFYLSFTGVITFTHDYDEVIKNTPLDRIMAETDAPYVSPVPNRGKRNEPANVEYVARRIAEIKGLPEEEVLPQLVQNARNLFKI